MSNVKISDLTQVGSAATTDLKEISKLVSTGPNVYVSYSESNAQLITLLETALPSVQLNNTGLQIKSTSGIYYLTVQPGSTLTANRALTITTGDSDRTISLGGSITTANSLQTSGNYPVVLTFTASTNVTFPVTGTLATLAGAETLTNKTISGSSNTLSAIANASLTNSAITINGTSVSLGGSIVVSGTSTAFPLTIGTGLNGTSFNGSAPVTISIDSTVATLAGSQVFTNKTLLSGTISTALNFLDPTTPSKQLHFNTSLMPAVTQTNLIFSGDANVTFPAGNYTVGNTTVSGDITPFIVGTTLADAPYTSISAAGLAASAFASTSTPQFVYIQAGIYTEDPVLYPYVHYISLAASMNNEFSIVGSMPVKIFGSFVFSNTLGSDTETNIVGLEIITPPGGDAALNVSGSYNIKINLINSILTGSNENAITNTNPNLILNCYASTIQADTGRQAFAISSGQVNLLNGTNVISTDSGSEILSGGSITIEAGCSVKDSFDIGTISSFTANYAKLTSLPGLAFLNYVDNLSIADIQNCIIDSSSVGYSITATLGGVYKYANNVFLDNPLIDPSLTLTPYGSHQGHVSYDGGTYYLSTTLEGNVTANYRAGSYTVVGNVVNSVTGNINMNPNETYICRAAGNIELTLPVSAAIGDTLKICGLYSGGVNLWIIKQNAGQSISVGTGQTTGGVAGSITSNQRSSIDLICVDTDTTWIATSVVGSLIIV